ncbi:NAD(P)H-hydrate dehydratase [Candidatus Desulfovibrio trichonymphae]|uniref:Bifunctional NAD(P)H-hydrate repair enzyme n=1 Tax=Candidatus Desulfovibrio trichonymphae TaxID=1725232 RepID=A0A1J1DWL4_9BACT|nr:NAD(P)H-hydrate dehydratase [Candidatus Desulfovibrio trichonymphae]BAV92260.1 bifunctional NAD(P)H-hydrate repair enzyme Nnr [Candidatus Desulfovibrio trichonymphae]
MLSNTAVINALSPLPLPHEMREWDAQTISLGFPEVMLMENAGRAAFDVLRRALPNIADERVWLFMGGGGNGGDAACLARCLLDAGCRVLVSHIKALGMYRGGAAKHIRMAKAAGVVFAPLSRRIQDNAPAILVDGLLGTGFAGELRSPLRELVDLINTLAPSRFVLSLDIPSGLHGVTGRPSPVAVRADATVSFAAAKPGLVLPWAKHWTGRLHIRPVGIPAFVRSKAPCSARLLDGRCLACLPNILHDAYKNRFGHVLVIGGIPTYSGAAHLAALAALRAGAGLVTAAAPAISASAIRNSLREVMTLPLGEAGGKTWPTTLPVSLLELLARSDALVVGPGMGRTGDAAVFLTALLSLPKRPPAVFDADALRLLAERPDTLRTINERDILTPHPGEAAALLHADTADVQSDRQAALSSLCDLCPCAVVLKGAGTLVGQKGMPVLISPYDVPQLATAGAGDVLAGCLGALLACAGTHAPASLAAAALGVVLHALAGRVCANAFPARGNIAGEVADAIPIARAKAAQSAPDEEILPWPE